MRLSGTIAKQPTDETSASAQTEGAKGTQDTQPKLGGATVQPTRGQTIRRNIANFFKSIGQAFVSLHNRVEAHKAERKLASATKSAEREADKIVKAAGKDSPDIRMGIMLPRMLGKAARLAKLDPSGTQDPATKALELLMAAENKTPIADRMAYGTTKWTAMESKINQVIDFTMGRNRDTTKQIARSNPGVDIHVTDDQDIADVKTSVKSLLTKLQTEADKNAPVYANMAKSVSSDGTTDAALSAFKSAKGFNAKLDCIEDAMDAYFGQDGTNAGNVLRGNSSMTKAIKEFIVSTHASSKGDLSDMLTDTLKRVDCSSIPDEAFNTSRIADANGSLLTNKLNESQVTPERFKVVQDVALNMIKGLIGGSDPADIKEAAKRLPNETVQILQALDRKVAAQFPGDDLIAVNAFVGTLFLRFQVADVVMDANSTTISGRGRAEQGVAKMAANLVNTTFNMAAEQKETTKADAKFPPETAKLYREFVSEYADAVLAFREAVLARDTY